MRGAAARKQGGFGGPDIVAGWLEHAPSRYELNARCLEHYTESLERDGALWFQTYPQMPTPDVFL